MKVRVLLLLFVTAGFVTWWLLSLRRDSAITGPTGGVLGRNLEVSDTITLQSVMPQTPINQTSTFPVSEQAIKLLKLIKWLKADEAGRFSFDEIRSKAKPISVGEIDTPHDRPRTMASRAEAMDLLLSKFSFPVLPTFAFEDNSFFYFSGGINAYKILDFSEGIIVRKTDGEVSTWGVK